MYALASVCFRGNKPFQPQCGHMLVRRIKTTLKMATGTSRIGQARPGDFRPRPVQVPSAVTTLEDRLAQAIERGAQHLLSLQAQEGYWLGELEADTTLESDYIYYLFVLGKAEPGRIAKLANYVRCRQLPDGGWNIYFGGPSELNATVKAYFALKLTGDSPLGGLEATNSYTRFYLALVGVVGWDMVPAVPPELLLLPTWFYLNIYELSSWTRGIVIPLAILYALKPRWNLPVEVKVDELFRTPGRAARSFDVSQVVSPGEFAVRGSLLDVFPMGAAAPLRRRSSGCSSIWSAARALRRSTPP